MSASSRNALRVAAIAVTALSAGMVLPAACLFPEYTFDLGATGGTGGMASSSSTGGRGGSGVTSSSTTSSSTSTSSGGGTGGMSTGGMGGTGGATSSSSTSSGTLCSTADCSDPACQSSYACVPSAPTGWTGYFELYDGPAAGDPGCGDTFKTQAFIGNAGFSAAAPTCSQCTCAAPQNQTCVVPPTVSVSDAACGGAPFCGADLPTDWSAPCTTTMQSPYISGGNKTCGPNANATCSTTTGADCNVSLTMAATTVTGGSCTPSTVMATKPAPTWQSVGEACGGATNGTGCSGNQVCMPKPESGFGAKLCIMKAGNNPCPAGQFSVPHLFYTGFTDNRDCTPCTCGAPGGASCTAKVDIYSTINTCSGTPIATLNLDTNNGACVGINNPQVAGRKATTTAPTGGNCAPSGGQATGAAVEDSATATTFCCIQ